ncbi:MAG TPA: S53 family peptidase [Puia sp.]|nr:S53 family peptidase [Puia sp.]
MPTAKKTQSKPSLIFESRLELPGSFRKIPYGKNTGSTSLNELIEVMVKIRRKSPIQTFIRGLSTGKNQPVTPDVFDRRYGASMEDINLVIDFARLFDLTVLQTSVSRRCIILKGSVLKFSEAFGVYLSNFSPEFGITYRGRNGAIQIPEILKDIITGVFGLDNRPQARPMFHILKKDGRMISPQAATVSYNPDAVAKAYKYPRDVDGIGECIAIIELGGGFRNEDMKNYFNNLGLPLPQITAISADGALNAPSTPDSADGEVALDIEVAGAVAPGAKIVVYFASNTDKGFLDAISTAIHDTLNKPSVISISWGGAESQWSDQAIQNFNETLMSAAALGITVLVAAGDNGSSDGQTDGNAHVDFPASSPYALACGGTRLLSNDETVWNDQDGQATGGGISDKFPVPDYQKNLSLPSSVNSDKRKGRGLPDIAANADPATGYNVLVDGQRIVVGGTSAVAPLIAGLIALANQKLKRNSGFIHPKLYTAKTSLFKDIISGNNITAESGGYTAGPGWDACSGLGVPLGNIISVL